ncbi:hypothetical protein [Acidovorax sp. sif0715]|uniref:hypothetical protein n=1 Tax=Acidovorax sp. sif0715 TaxID=2854790 RepID=UPI001C44CA8B|nr:hypothetical protein [Acidovorax sp. sif0715]
MGEQSAPKSFHLVAVLVTISLGLAVALWGRQAEPSPARIFFCYCPAEIALSFCAVFVGLLAGFGLGVNHLPLAGGAIVAFIFSGALLLGVLWLSFPARVVPNETQARLAALAFIAGSILILCWTFRK